MFGQFIEYILKKIFLKKSYINRGRKAILRPFSKKLKMTIYPDKYSKAL